jgi:hypothetical protein
MRLVTVKHVELHLSTKTKIQDKSDVIKWTNNIRNKKSHSKQNKQLIPGEQYETYRIWSKDSSKKV